MNVLMIGATGHYAGLVVPELTKRGVTVRALVQAESKAAAARQRGATETVVGDLLDPTSLRAAAEGMDGVFYLNPAFAPGAATMGTNMVAAAQAAGVRKFTFSSVIHPSLALANHADKRPVEAALYDSGLTFTVLQPTMFMQNLAGSWPQIVKSGKLVMPYSKHAKVCYVDYRDVAEVAALALTGTALDEGTFELCAPGLLDRVQLAALMSEVAGQPIEAGEIAPAEWAKTAPMPPGPLRDGLLAMNKAYDEHGFAGGNALVLRAILGREPRTLRQFIQELVNKQ